MIFTILYILAFVQNCLKSENHRTTFHSTEKHKFERISINLALELIKQKTFHFVKILSH